ncbi:hypothetical protein PQX77_006467 [Marasmius sp. AFHP31]|nr:hypothetical protein PQX77_006467 [Marasmius sp. AFHP31]
MVYCIHSGCEARALTKVYEEMYPDATQVVRNERGFFFSREATSNGVIEVLEALGCIPKNKEEERRVRRPRILIPSLSNGKCPNNSFFAAPS